MQGKSALKGAETARIVLKILETLTYSCEDVQACLKLNKTFHESLATFKHALPNTEGLKKEPQHVKPQQNSKF